MPHFEHDCDICTFIGSFMYDGQDYDAYITCDASQSRYIARFGSYGDYITVLGNESRLYARCLSLHVTHALLNRNRLSVELDEAERTLKSLQEENEELYWKQSGDDEELLAMESDAENGTAY